MKLLNYTKKDDEYTSNKEHEKALELHSKFLQSKLTEHFMRTRFQALNTY